MQFKDLGLSAELLRAIKVKGYETATPIQAQAIPLVLEGGDVLAGAQTGTGKTAGFTLPILQSLQDSDRRGGRRYIRTLILVPTRELAAQVDESVRDYGRFLPFRSTVIFGGVSFNRQLGKLRQGVDIVVATPGRLLDHLQQGTIDLRDVDTLVLDEADRMLDMGFIHDIKKILARLPEDRQNLLFSATLSSEIKQLAGDFLYDPAEIQVAARNTAAESVAQLVIPVDKTRKRELLSWLMREEDWRQVLVFSRTKHGANRLAKQLTADGHSATAIHGNKSQGARTKALASFKQGNVRVLVATDIAARGLDISLLPHVVNFDLPNVPEDYVHRIGRTGRAGQDGEAISLVSAEERGLLRDIERLLDRHIDQEIIAGFEPLVTEAPKEPKKNGRNGRSSQGGRPAEGRRAPRRDGRGRRRVR
jgi:ATP-dependent RNA helicase RhlE